MSVIWGAMPTQKSYVVGSVFQIGMSEYDQLYIYMPLQQAQLFFGRAESVDFIEVKFDSPDRAPKMKGDLERAAGPGAQ